MAPNTQNGSSGSVTAKIPASLIDMHCHVFNASDLPASNFLRRVITESHSASADAGTLGIGTLISLVVGNAPTAAAELADIARGHPTPDASAAVASAGADSGLLGWLRLFAKPRRQLIATLASFYAATQNRCELITPAMVDFNCWLDHPDSEGQRLTDQVAVTGAIARLAGNRACTVSSVSIRCAPFGQQRLQPLRPHRARGHRPA